jgi:repressor LexA
MASRLSSRQSAMLEYIERYLKQFGYPPSMRELARLINSSTSVVDFNLRALERAGYIERQRERSRALKVLRSLNSPPPQRITRIERIRVVARLFGTELEPLEDQYIDLPGSQVPPGCVAIQVRGIGMQTQHIDDGDYLVIHGDGALKTGDLAFIVFGPQHQQGAIRLLREAPDGRMILNGNTLSSGAHWPEDNFEIRGRAIKLVRDF